VNEKYTITSLMHVHI